MPGRQLHERHVPVSVQGGDNTDAIYGLGGADRLSGGDGADTFYFLSLADSGTKASNRDLITDYSRFSGDKIDLSAIDAPESPAHLSEYGTHAHEA